MQTCLREAGTLALLAFEISSQSCRAAFRSSGRFLV
jgi:hypothetical protein